MAFKAAVYCAPTVPSASLPSWMSKGVVVSGSGRSGRDCRVGVARRLGQPVPTPSTFAQQVPDGRVSATMRGAEPGGRVAPGQEGGRIIDQGSSVPPALYTCKAASRFPPAD